MHLTYLLTTAVQRETPFGTETYTHESFDYRHDPRAARVRSHRALGVLEGGAFRPSPVPMGENVTIEGADYDALCSSGSAAGRFWPEDVVSKHREIAARPQA